MDEIISSNAPEYKDYQDEGYEEYKKQGIDRIFFNAPHVLIFHSNNLGDAMNAPIGITYGMLSAHSLGLGSCWIGLAQGVLNSYREIREKFLGNSDNIWGVITLGYPKPGLKVYRSPPRPDLITKGLEAL
jgi:nitroreductase